MFGILKGVKVGPRGPTDAALGEVFLKQAQKNGDVVFQIDADTEKQETFRQVKQRSVPVAVELQKLGVGAEDVVLLCCKNNSDNVIPALAAWYLGAIVASVHPKQTPSEIRHNLAIAEPKIVFVIDEAVDLMEEALKGSESPPAIVVIGSSNKYKTMGEMEQAVVNEIDAFTPARVKADQTAVIMFSSGTTSAPKGICLSHYFLLYGTHGVAEQHGHNMDVIIHFASLQWVSGMFLTGWCIAAAKTKVIGSNITAERFLELVDKFKITYAFTSSTFTYSITNLAQEVVDKYDTSSLQAVHVGGSTVDPKQILRLRSVLKHTKVTVAYGSSESHYATSFDSKCEKAYEEKIESSGLPLPDVELKFLDLDTEEPLGAYKQGEIRIKSPYLTTGYYRLPKPDLFDDDGFLRQGDIGYYDDDGYVYVTDRINETFKYKSEHVSPSLVESALLEHPSVKEAVVIGLPHPVDRYHAAAAIVLRNDAKVNLDELVKSVNEKVPDSHRLRGGVKVLDRLPKTPSGKIQRRSIRDDFLKK